MSRACAEVPLDVIVPWRGYAAFLAARVGRGEPSGGATGTGAAVSQPARRSVLDELLGIEEYRPGQ